MMMDKKTLLENGLLEQYLLGELNAIECAQIEQLLVSDTEIKAHFDQLEQDFETIGLENAITPPALVKTQLINKITSPSNENKVVNLKANQSSKFYLGIAASIATLLLVGSFWMYNQLNDVKQQLQTVENEKIELNSTIENLNKQLENKTTLYAVIAHPETNKYILNGNDLLPEAKVISYINHDTKSVVINTERLPNLDNEHDYQMWADVEGEMINMGVISKNQNLMAMNYIDHAESLNITIESAGGNDHPTVSRLVTNVYLK